MTFYAFNVHLTLLWMLAAGFPLKPQVWRCFDQQLNLSCHNYCGWPSISHHLRNPGMMRSPGKFWFFVNHKSLGFGPVVQSHVGLAFFPHGPPRSTRTSSVRTEGAELFCSRRRISVWPSSGWRPGRRNSTRGKGRRAWWVGVRRRCASIEFDWT